MNIHSILAFLYAIIVGKITDAVKISELEDQFTTMNSFFSFDVLTKLAEITKKVIELMRGYKHEINVLECELLGSMEMNDLLRYQLTEMKNNTITTVNSMRREIEIIENISEELHKKAQVANVLLNHGAEDEMFLLIYQTYRKSGRGGWDAFSIVCDMVQDINPDWEYDQARTYLRELIFVKKPTNMDEIEV